MWCRSPDPQGLAYSGVVVHYEDGSLGRQREEEHNAHNHRGHPEMNAVKIAGIVLITAGTLGLVYGGFSYTKETHEAKIGPLELSVKDKETVNVPVWAGVGAIVVGGLLLLVPTRN